MTIYFDDNFGAWDGMEDPEMREFYMKIQNSNVEKKCGRCGRTVMLQPQYAICDSCATAIERGGDYY